MRELFESTIKRICEDHVSAECVSQAEQGHWPSELWGLLENSGFNQAVVFDESGEAGVGWSELCGVLMTCGQYSLPLPLSESMFVNYLLSRVGLKTVAGSASFSADSDLRIDGDVVTGQLRSVPWGRDVDHILGIAQGPCPTFVLVSRASAAEISKTTNIAGEPRDNLSFEAAAVVATAPLPATMDADILRLGGAMLRSAQIAGALQGVLALASQYVNDRVQFGRPIARFQAVQHQMAICAEQTAAAVVSAELACAQFDCGVAVPVMVAKISASEAAAAGAAISHSVHGAIGFTQEYPLQHSTRRLWSWRSEYGSLSFWSQRLGTLVCEAGSENYWPAIVNASFESTQEN